MRSVFVPEAKVKAYAAAKSGGGELPPLALPFVDDFAWPSFFEDDVAINLKRWEASPVRRTTTLAYQPPTVGCATLDGLDPEGNPYMLNPTNASGYADTLTSRRLLLASSVASDSVALTFWYQSGGVANGADAGEKTAWWLNFAPAFRKATRGVGCGARGLRSGNLRTQLMLRQ